MTALNLAHSVTFATGGDAYLRKRFQIKKPGSTGAYGGDEQPDFRAGSLEASERLSVNGSASADILAQTIVNIAEISTLDDMRQCLSEARKHTHVAYVLGKPSPNMMADTRRIEPDQFRTSTPWRRGHRPASR